LIKTHIHVINVPDTKTVSQETNNKEIPLTTIRTDTYPDSHYFRKLALRAGEITRSNFALGMAREIKDDDTPLTATDTVINQMVLDAIGQDFPHIHVVGEEGSLEVPNAEYVVYCDPVDGTIPFCRGIPISAFCISVIKGNTPLSAVIYDPFQERLWEADRNRSTCLWTKKLVPASDGYVGPPHTGHGSYESWESSPVFVSNHDTVNRSSLCMIWWKGSPYNLHGVCQKLMDEGAGWMNPVSIAYFGGLVASGELDATIFPGQKAWETAAMQLIVEGAGGKATDIHGNPIVYGKNGEIEGHIISNGRFHDQLVEIVRSCQ